MNARHLKITALFLHNIFTSGLSVTACPFGNSINHHKMIYSVFRERKEENEKN